MKSRLPNPRLAQIRAAVERHREDLALIHAVSEAANESSDLRSVLAEILEMICEHMDWEFGHALTVESQPEGRPRRMRSLGIWYLYERNALAELRESSLSIGPTDPIHCLIDAEVPVISRDLPSEPNFERLQVTESSGLSHYYALPIVSRHVVVGALEFMSTAQRVRDDEHLSLILANIGASIGRLAEREASERERLILIRTELAREEAEQRAAELQHLTDALRRRNRELDQFAYVASHDLRAPLRGINNLATWIAEELEPHLTDDSRRYLELLRGRVGRMESLINGLLEYSRIGRKAAPEEQVDVEALVRETIDMLDTGGDIEWVLAEMPAVRGNRMLLGQVFHNLMSNALKYATADCPRVEIQAEAIDTGVWRFYVRDNGPGIAPRYHDRVWEIFQVLQPRDEVEGTGIGLSLVRKIVEQRGGEVGLESDVDAGATFMFTWPDRPNREDSDVHDAPSSR